MLLGLALLRWCPPVKDFWPAVWVAMQRLVLEEQRTPDVQVCVFGGVGGGAWGVGVGQARGWQGSWWGIGKGLPPSDPEELVRRHVHDGWGAVCLCITAACVVGSRRNGVRL